MISERYSLDQIKENIKKNFGENDSYLLALKQEGFKRGLSKIVSTNLLINREKSDLYILFFDEKGIYRKNITEKLDDDYKLISWKRIDFVNLVEKTRVSILEISHMGEKIGFEIPYEGDLYKENKENLKKLKEKNWNNSESLEDILQDE